MHKEDTGTNVDVFKRLADGDDVGPLPSVIDVPAELLRAPSALWAWRARPTHAAVRWELDYNGDTVFSTVTNRPTRGAPVVHVLRALGQFLRVPSHRDVEHGAPAFGDHGVLRSRIVDRDRLSRISKASALASIEGELVEGLVLGELTFDGARLPLLEVVWRGGRLYAEGEDFVSAFGRTLTAPQLAVRGSRDRFAYLNAQVHWAWLTAFDPSLG